MVHLGPTEPVEIPETFRVFVRFSKRTSTSRDVLALADWIMTEMDPGDDDLVVFWDTVSLNNLQTIDAANHVVDRVVNTVVTEPGFEMFVARK